MAPLATRHQWMPKDVPKDCSLDGFMALKCVDKHEPGLLQITPYILDLPPVIYYANCPANLYCAFRRQLLETVQPESNLAERFSKFADRLIAVEMIPIIEEFDYDFNVWYNHLTSNQQMELEKVNKEKLDKRAYDVFCKRELQIVETDIALGVTKYPKNRCISSPNVEHKFVMGPIIYSLEYQMKRKLKGYCSGVSWRDREILLNQRKARGLTLLVNGDFSGWDLSQKHELKVCRKIHALLVHFGRINVEDEISFTTQAQQQHTRLTMSYYDRKTKMRRSFGYAVVDGTVFSGSMDTTNSNTLQNVFIIRFICEELLELTREWYDLDCAGDDFDIFLPEMFDRNKVREAFRLVCSTEKTGEHGLGLTLKFLNFGSIEGSDFCSTETFWCDGCNSYKIVRKLSRFAVMTPWSHKALELSTTQKQIYMTAMYQANKRWMNSLPIFEQINNYLNYGNSDYEKLLVGKVKKKLPVDKKYAYLQEHSDVLLEMLKARDKDFYYANKDRISEKKSCCAKAYKLVLNTRYNLSDGEIESIIQELNKGRERESIFLPALVKAFDFRAKYCFVDN